MNNMDYIEILQKRLSKCFDIELNKQLTSNLKLDLFAKYSLSTNLTAVSKSNIIDSYKINEFFLVKNLNDLDDKKVHLFFESIKHSIDDLVLPDRTHKNSTINAVIISSTFSENKVSSLSKNLHYTKIHKFFLNGWTDLRLIIVLLKDNNTIISTKDEHLQKLLSVY